MAQLDALGIIATDLDTTVSFYRLLGCELSYEADGHKEVEFANGFRLMFDSVEMIESFSTYTPAQGGRNVGLAFGCDSAAEVDALYAAVVAAGPMGHKEPFDAPWGQRYATVLDPDENPVDLYAVLD